MSTSTACSARGGEQYSSSAPPRAQDRGGARAGRALSVGVVSVDSAGVCRGMDVSTAKPDAESRARVPQHLVDILEPTEAYSAGRFRDDALRIAAVCAGRIPSSPAAPCSTSARSRRARRPACGARRLRARDRGARAARRLGAIACRAGTGRPGERRAHRSRVQRIQRALKSTTSPASCRTSTGWETATLPLRCSSLALEPADRACACRAPRALPRDARAGLVEELEGLRRATRAHERMPSMRGSAIARRGRCSRTQPAATSRQRARGRDAPARQAPSSRGCAAARIGIERLDCLRPDLQAAAARRVERFLAG